jgi:2,4-dienoyl-CoA reductase-like NADH-dependent reductase (Old Yellow Enzyme family)
MTRVSASSDGVPGGLMEDHYRAFGDGGWALMFTEGTYIDEQHSQGYKNQPGIANERHVEGWKPIVATAKRSGALFFQQLIHAGALIQENVYVDQAIAPSAVEVVGKMLPHYFGEGGFPRPREITKQEIAQTVDGYAEAALRSVEAGFDGVEIHGANGYLLDQFLTVLANKRNDEYGGTVENMVRMHCEVVRAVKSAVGANVPVGIRISQTKVNNFDYMWPGGPDDARIIFAEVSEAGPDYIHISTHKGLEEVWDSGRNLADWAHELASCPIVACGGLNDPDRAERLLAEGKADFTAMGKGALADPDWPRKIAEGETPVTFDPGMIKPLATLENTRDWRAANS